MGSPKGWVVAMAVSAAVTITGFMLGFGGVAWELNAGGGPAAEFDEQTEFARMTGSSPVDRVVAMSKWVVTIGMACFLAALSGYFIARRRAPRRGRQ